MRLARVVVLVLLAGSFSGCTWLRESWPWRKKDVPVTPPSEMAPAEEQPPATEPAPETAPAEPTEPETPAPSEPTAAPAETPQPAEEVQPQPAPEPLESPTVDPAAQDALETQAPMADEPSDLAVVEEPSAMVEQDQPDDMDEPAAEEGNNAHADEANGHVTAAQPAERDEADDADEPVDEDEPAAVEDEPAAGEETVEPQELAQSAPVRDLPLPALTAEEPAAEEEEVAAIEEPAAAMDEPVETAATQPAQEPAGAVEPYSGLPPAVKKVSPSGVDPLPPLTEPARETRPAAAATETAPDAIAPESAEPVAPAAETSTAPEAQPVEPPAPNLPPLEIDGPVMLESLVPGAEQQTTTEETLGDLAGETKPQAEPATDEAVTEPEPQPQTATAPVEDIIPPHRLPEPEPIEFGKEEVVAASLLQINNEFVTVDDLLREASEELTAMPGRLSEEQFRARAAEILKRQTRSMVVQRLVQAEAKDRIPEGQQKLIDEDLAEMQRKLTAENGGSPQKLAAALARRGTDLETVMSAERRRLTAQAFLQTRFYPAISVTRRMLWDYYRDHLGEFTVDKKVQMQIIAAPYEAFLPEGGATSAASEDERRAAAMRAERLINEAMTALRSGEDFGEVARRLSRGPKAGTDGVWPTMPAGSFKEADVEAAAFALEEGQVSDIIQTATGYYIVRARKVDGGKTVPFEHAQEQIDKKLRDQQFDKLQQEYFARLIDAAQIHQSEKFLALAIDRAAKRFWRR